MKQGMLGKIAMNYRISDCCDLAPAQLCAAMNAAFSDYVIPLKLSETAFRTFQRQRGFSAEHSFVARQGDDIAAFWFSGKPRAEYGSLAYTLSVGTLPDHRRKGLSRQLLDAVTAQQRLSGSKGLQLEVITTNEAAISSYEAMGFYRHRTLRVLKLSSEPASQSLDYVPHPLDLSRIPTETDGFFDTEPTPQNGRCALQALSPDHHLLGIEVEGELLGWGAVYPDGAVAQIAVHHSVRRKGLGRAILRALWQAAGEDALTFVNVDESAATQNGFLEHVGAQELLQQYEMQLRFS
ncbi:hypothetical protein CHH27_03430 [Labrenzia sp. VG12]|nr:hypothetical protein CHH27_03430 [Labrenzia sp. VG12]